MSKTEATTQIQTLKARLNQMLASFPLLMQEAERTWQQKVDALVQKNCVITALKKAEQLLKRFAQKVQRTAERLFNRAKARLEEISDPDFLALMTPNWRRIEQTYQAGNHALLAIQTRWALDKLDLYDAQFGCAA